MTDDLRETMEKFAAERINHHGENEPENLQNLYRELEAAGNRLLETMSKEQLKLLEVCEGLYGELDAETMRFYYKSGLRDAVQFLLWNKSDV